MAEEKLIVIEEDATNAIGFLIDDIQELEYEQRSSGVGTVQVLTLKLSNRTVILSGTEATTVYAAIKDSFSEGGADARPDPTETTQVAIYAALQQLGNLRNVLFSVAGGIFMRVGTDGVALEMDASP